MATFEGHVVYQNLMRILFDSLKPKAPLHIKKFNVVFFSAIYILKWYPLLLLLSYLNVNSLTTNDLIGDY